MNLTAPFHGVVRSRSLAEEFLPEGWKNWRTLDLSREEVFGDGEVDAQTLNKIRFALPTLGIARSFNPSIQTLPEKQFRDMKVKMLGWALCRALIISPPAILNRIKGSSGQGAIFLTAVSPIKDMLLTRKQAAQILSGGDSDGESQSSSRKRRLSTSEGSPKKSRLDLMEQKMDRMFSVLLDKIEGKSQCPPSSRDCEYTDPEYTDIDEEDTE